MKYIQSLLTILLLITLLVISIFNGNTALAIILSIIIGFISGVTILSFYLSIIKDVNKFIEKTNIVDTEISVNKINHSTPEIDLLMNEKCEGK